MKFKWHYGENSSVTTDALYLRKKVFIDEQGISEKIEFDGRDHDCYHVVGYHDNQPVATARLDLSESKTAIIQRVVVQPKLRGQHLGLQLLTEIARFSKEQHLKKLKLSSQKQVIPFYQKAGFKLTDRPEYIDAGIPHRDMVLKI